MSGTYLAFHFYSKCSLLKLLCTLARLCEGTPLQTLGLDPNWNFLQVFQQNKGEITSSISLLRYPIIPPPQHHAPIHWPIITIQGKQRSIPRWRAPMEDVPIDLVFIYLVSNVVIFFVPRATPSSAPEGHWSRLRILPTPPMEISVALASS